MMRVIGLAALYCVLTPALTQAQTPEIQNQVNLKLRDARAAAQQEGMYENIEIMRRILQRALGSVFAGQQTGYANEVDAHLAKTYFDGIGDPRILGGQYGARVNANDTTARLFDPYTAQSLNTIYGDLVKTQPRWASAGTAVEGVYLKGQGVVYTVTLPTHERVLRDPHSNQIMNAAYCTACHVAAFHLPQEKTVPPDKLPSLWEQTRREVKGQPGEPTKKSTADTKKLEVCAPGTVGDTLLRLLAENGKNLTLTGKENVTVVVTFRPEAGGTGPAGRYYRADAQSNTVTEVPPAGVDPNFAAAPPSSAGQVTPPVTEGGKGEKSANWMKQSYENLGDLHVKQKHYGEAVEAYYKALGQSKDQKQQDVIRGKLLDALKAQLQAIDVILSDAKDTQDSRKRFHEAAAAYMKALELKQPEAKPKTSSLPAKLIITASKDLLDQIGQGKLSFEDFKKAATVEYLTFGAATK